MSAVTAPGELMGARADPVACGGRLSIALRATTVGAGGEARPRSRAGGHVGRGPPSQGSRALPSHEEGPAMSTRAHRIASVRAPLPPFCAITAQLSPSPDGVRVRHGLCCRVYPGCSTGVELRDRAAAAASLDGLPNVRLSVPAHRPTPPACR